MGRYLTFEHLRSQSSNYLLQHVINKNHIFAASGNRVTVFLSHRHSEDETLIKQVRGFFASMGADLYIDWQDEDMPPVTSSETAEKLKKRIKQSKKFVVLATPKSIESIWIPWEIGLADQIKGLENMAILPIVNEDNKWENREYYQLYSRIECVGGKWTVLNPGYSYLGTDLVTWLQK